ncbi:hypothetical protein D3C81_1586670 [compost metagenome]
MQNCQDSVVTSNTLEALDEQASCHLNFLDIFASNFWHVSHVIFGELFQIFFADGIAFRLRQVGDSFDRDLAFSYQSIELFLAEFGISFDKGTSVRSQSILYQTDQKILNFLIFRSQ